jgi:hypothetical protein
LDFLRTKHVGDVPEQVEEKIEEKIEVFKD